MHRQSARQSANATPEIQCNAQPQRYVQSSEVRYDLLDLTPPGFKDLLFSPFSTLLRRIRQHGPIRIVTPQVFPLFLITIHSLHCRRSPSTPRKKLEKISCRRTISAVADGATMRSVTPGLSAP